MRSIALCLLFSLSFLASASASEVILFSPEGNVKNIKQVLVRFSSDMTALGDPRDTIHPLVPSCLDTKGAEIKLPDSQSRWADSRNWVLDYATPLNAGVRCTFTLKENLKDLKGDKVTAKPNYSFSTSGPAVREWFPQYSQIEPEQYFLLQLDGAIDESSLVKNAFFEVQGLNEKVIVNIIKGSDREDIIAAQFGRRHKKDLKELLKNLDDKLVVVSAGRRFPEGAKVVLHWTTGILSKTGVAVTEAQNLEFTVIEPFKATFTCERSEANKFCTPISQMQVYFSNKVKLKDLESARLTATDGQSWKAVEFENAKNKSKNSNDDEDQTIQSLTFRGPFPEKKKFKITIPAKLRDDIGRPLSNAKEYPLSVATDEFSPLIKFSGRFGVLELNADPLLPVSVRNIEKTISLKQEGAEGKSFNLSSMDQVKDVIRLYESAIDKDEYPNQKADPRNLELLSSKKAKAFTLPKPSGEHEFEMMGIPLKEPGFYVVEIKSPKLGDALTATKKPMYVVTSALVTNMGIHFKKGIESSLVWVTQLDNAKPVGDAAISVRNCEGTELASGKTNNDGILKLTTFKETKKLTRKDCRQWNDTYYVFAKKGNDFSFMNTGWNQGIESWRYQVSTERSYEREKWGSFIGHTVMDRTLFKSGDTVQMKHILREHHQNGFSMANPKIWPKAVLIRHSGSGKVYSLPIKIDAKTGTALSSFAITKEMPLGNYEVYLSNKVVSEKKKKEIKDDYDDQEGDGSSQSFDWDAKRTGEFLVSEFRLPLMAATVKVQGETLVRTSSAKIDLSAHYMSGGPAVKLAVKTRSQLSPSYFAPDFFGAEEYSFFAEPVKKGFVEREAVEPKAEDIKINNFVLDNKGGALLAVEGLEVSNRPKNLVVEMEYTDPNGEVKTASGSKMIFPSKNIVGLRIDSWFGSSSATKILGVITNPESKLVKGVKYTVEAFKSESYTHRKRLVGGFYSYDSKTEIKSLGIVCEGESSSDGRFECLPKNLPAGSITLQARVADDSKAESFASVDVNIFAQGEDNWWTPGDSDRIDILASKKMYEPNESAQFIVKTPFKEASALVTIEREGILDQFITTVKRDNPIINVPMKGLYAPNVFVSVMLVRGRVGEPKPDFLVDLGKPVMKMGLAEVKVGWGAHQLKVDVSTDLKKYNVRDNAKVTIKLTTPDGSPLPKETEVILAAVDESLLHLKNNESVNLLSAMMESRGLGVESSSSLNQVIGRRHFGLKAKAPGGGGGMMEGAREHFDPLLAFIPNLKVNDKGEVTTTIKLNDSISSFRIMAVAHAGANLFGTGKVNIVTNKDIILYSGISPVARSGDLIQNVFTMRNTTSTPMKVQLTATAVGLTEALPAFPVMELLPSETKVINLPINVPAKLKELEFNVSAKDLETGAHDELKVKEALSPAVPERVLQATLFQLDKNFTVPVKQPSDAILNSGGVSMSARASLVQGLTGVKSYMEDYPYSCLEQRTSKAIVLDNKKEMKKIIEDLPSFIDSDGLLKFFDWPNGCGSAQLTHYILDILDENKYDVPNSIQDRLVDGLKNDLAGRLTCYPWWYNRTQMTKDKYYDQEKILLLETLSRYKNFDPKSLESINITPNLWSTETLVNWVGILNREKTLPKRDEFLKQAQTILDARVNFQGSMMTLQESLSGEGSWRLFSSKDQEALGVFGVLIDRNQPSDDAGRMARGLIARLHLGHWDTTVANAWGITMMKKFSEKFEKIKITGTTDVIASDVKASVDWTKNPKGEKNILSWPVDSQSKEVAMNFSHNGTGKPWVHLETSSAIPLKSPMNFGYTITKTITAIDQKVKGKWSVGDVVNVELTVLAGNDQSWVVLRDPLPSGASHLGTGLSGESAILNVAPKSDDKNNENGWPSEYEEKSFSNFTTYAGYLPAGTYKTNYRYRLNSAGTFKLPPTRAEAMYSPEVFGEIPNVEFTVAP